MSRRKIKRRLRRSKRKFYLSARRRKYQLYMRSPAWRKKRRLVLKRDKHRCTECGSKWKLHVHHLTYVRLGHERLTDLTTLCQICHDAVHTRKKTVKVA